MNNPTLVLDCMNIFIRCYAANPKMSAQGFHVGGVVGFLKTLRGVCNKFSPGKIVAVWEGGGSSRRRAIYPAYKKGKKPKRMNRFYEDDIPDSEKNKNFQIATLISMLKDLPICQVYVNDCECDDVIGYLCQYSLKDEKKVIISSDQDYYQLLNENTQIYRLGKKETVSAGDVLDLTGVTAANYCLAKCLVGDSSDNIKGIKGAGFKSVAKRFPGLGSEKECNLSEIFEAASGKRDEKIKLYREIADNFDIVKRNWRLIYLNTNNLSAAQMTQINHVIDTFEPRRNKISLMRGLIKVGVQSLDVEALMLSMIYVK
jgi:5'-3' exonuclease